MYGYRPAIANASAGRGRRESGALLIRMLITAFTHGMVFRRSPLEGHCYCFRVLKKHAPASERKTRRQILDSSDLMRSDLLPFMV
jgi:hypothetical protein